MKEMLEEAKRLILDSSPESSVYVGCDSKRFKKKDKWFARYAVVVIVHKESKHGCRVFHYEETHPDYGNLKNRLMTEVGMAVQVAMELTDVIGSRHMEVHLDINPDPKHKSSIAVKEALGWCMGMGFEAKVKPAGFAATHAADHVTRH